MILSLQTLTLSLPSIACNPLIVIMLHLSIPPIHYHFLFSQLGELTPPITSAKVGFKVTILQPLFLEGRDQILSLSLQNQLS